LQEDVDEYMKADENQEVEPVLRRFDEQHNKYKFMERNLLTKKARYCISTAMYYSHLYFFKLHMIWFLIYYWSDLVEIKIQFELKCPLDFNDFAKK
jgi:hypothetical protein